MDHRGVLLHPLWDLNRHAHMRVVRAELVLKFFLVMVRLLFILFLVVTHVVQLALPRRNRLVRVKLFSLRWGGTPSLGLPFLPWHHRVLVLAPLRGPGVYPHTHVQGVLAPQVLAPEEEKKQRLVLEPEWC